VTAAGLSLQQFGTHGALYGPGEGTALPGVVILHGAEGPMAGWSHRFAAILAAQGYLALAAEYGQGDFFGAGPIRDVPLPPILRRAGATASTSTPNPSSGHAFRPFSIGT